MMFYTARVRVSGRIGTLDAVRRVVTPCRPEDGPQIGAVILTERFLDPVFQSSTTLYEKYKSIDRRMDSTSGGHGDEAYRSSARPLPARALLGRLRNVGKVI